MNYVLVLYVCSAITGYCIETPVDNDIYPSFSKCVIEGSKRVTQSLNVIEPDNMELGKIYISYTCTEESRSSKQST